MGFPKQVPFWGNDRILSSMQLSIVDTESGEKEEVTMTSVMDIRRENPFTGSDGKRRIKVQVKDWTAIGFSKLLNKRVEYKMTPVKQPESHVIALQKENDFPARMDFHAMFDFYIDDRKELTMLSGTARATEMMSIPPRGEDLFAPEKVFEVGKYRFLAGACVASRIALTTFQSKLLSIGGALGLVSPEDRKNLGK